MSFERDLALNQIYNERVDAFIQLNKRHPTNDEITTIIDWIEDLELDARVERIIGRYHFQRYKQRRQIKEQENGI